MKTILSHIQTELHGLYPETEIRSFSYLLIEKITGFTRTEILVNKNTIFSDEQRQQLNSFVAKLKKNVPIQYILGETEFYGLTFRVNPSVLIPRPETEELVEWIRETYNPNTKLNILDIGTGSGCIAISLKHYFPNADVDAFDISTEALKTAKENARLNQTKVNFDIVDILNAPPQSKKWDIIISNPPYIPEQEKNDIQPNVLNHEPHLALFVPDNDSLLFYREIALFAYSHSQPSGKLFFEIHRDAGSSCIDLLTELGYSSVELRKDIFGNDRMIKAEK
jgi:release factor glutamine methyltransferase